MHNVKRYSTGMSCIRSFILVVIEILAIKIKNDNDIMGLPLNKKDTWNDLILKIFQHANDSTNMLKYTNFLRKAMETITELSKVAGPKLHLEKTECLLTVSFIDTCMHFNDSHIYGIKITKTCVKLLGYLPKTW